MTANMRRLPGGLHRAAGATLAGIAVGVTAWFLVTSTLPTWTFYAVPWLAAAGLGVGLSGRHPALKALGVALMSVPVWQTLLGILDSFGPLLQGGFTLRAYTTYQLSGVYTYKLLSDLGYLGAGFLFYAGGAAWFRQTPRTLAAALTREGLPMGRRSEGASILLGFLAFPVLLSATILVSTGLSGFESLQQSDESSVFANMTPYHAVILSLAAGFGEELVYRGFVQTFLLRAFKAFTGPTPGVRAGGLVAAIVVQALFFGFAHSGYATWIHVLLPTLFGLVAGVVAWRWGIWAAILLHVLVDIFAFGVEASTQSAWVIPVLNVLLLTNLVATLAAAAWWIWGRFQGNRMPTG